MPIPSNLNLRQMLEGMTLGYNPSAMPGLQAVIQFNVSGGEPGVYHLSIADAECVFHDGPAAAPTLTILTPSEVWLKISRGEMTGYDALLQELYTAEGDLTLLMKMAELFKSTDQVNYVAPATQRPAGPLPLSGMAWMTVAFVPWMIHWITFNLPGASYWLSVGTPLLLSALLVSYRLAFGRPTTKLSNSPTSQPATFMEWGGLGYFALAAVLALTGAPGYARWGSVISGFAMASLWLASLQFAPTPLSAEYSKWGFITSLWRNSLFLYPNAVISLVWGWEMILAALFGILAVLLPANMLLFTLVRYLLLIPTFIFTVMYQKRAPIANPRFTRAQLNFWASLGLSAIAGCLLVATMPGFDVPFIGWVALVPLLIVLLTAEAKRVFPLALPFGVIFSIGVHNWYPNIFPPALGYFLIFAVGTFYAGMLQVGVWLYTRLPAALKVLGLPVAWAAIEFVKYIVPVVEDWWFVLLADSQWRFPAALQPLSVTGVFGVSFLVMLVNVDIASLIVTRTQTVRRASLIALAVVALIVIGGALSLPQPDRPFKVAVLTDMVNQDARVLAQGEFAGTRVQSAEVSQAIFDTDAALTQQIAAQQPAFVVWPENEFSSTDDPQFITPLKTLAAEVQAYFTVDTAWSATTGLHDTALLIGPDGAEVGRRAKINLTSGEAKAGFVPGPMAFPVFQTPHGTAGIAICWDVHRLWIIRELARAGAQIILLPMDNDFDGVPTFPPFHAADAVFRAVENHLAFGLGTVNGVSMVIDPYGRITAEGKVNERGVTVGETFVANAPTLYTRFGDWFGVLMVIGLIGLVALSGLKNSRER